MQESPEWDCWVEKAFEVFDNDGSGRIGVTDLEKMLCKDGVCAMPDIVTSALRCDPEELLLVPEHVIVCLQFCLLRFKLAGR